MTRTSTTRTRWGLWAAPLSALSAALLTGALLSSPAQGASGEDTDNRVISTPGAPAAIGPYSQGIGAGKMLFLSGQLPMDPATGKLLTDASMTEQTRRVVRNLEAVLRADDMTLADVTSTTVYLRDLDDFDEFNAAYAEFFPKAPPARATVQVARLPKDADIEISAIAVR